MSPLIEEWVRGSLEMAEILAGPAAPRFTHGCVAEAYAKLEAHAIRRLRQGEPVWPDYHESLARRVTVLRVIDQAWSEPDGFVYVIAPRREADFDRLGHVKIGFSADPDARARQLQTGCHFALDVHNKVPATASVERALHGHLGAYRARGEWFRWDPAVDEALGCLSMVASAWGAERYGADR